FDAICNILGPRRIFAEPERVEQLVNDGCPDFLGVPVRRAGERATAHVNHAASNDREGQNAFLAASRMHFAVLNDEEPQVLGESWFQLRQPLLQRPPMLVDELGEKRLTGWHLKPLGCSLECLAYGIADVHVLDVDARPARRTRLPGGYFRPVPVSGRRPA